MDRLDSMALVLELVEKLKAAGSWCGETHIQKSAYMLQDMLDVPLDSHFTLYKHGPYSFDLSDRLAEMRAYGVLNLVPKSPYGPSIVSGGVAESLKRSAKEPDEEIKKKIEFIAGKVGPKKVAELERISTAWLVHQENPAADDWTVAKKITELKPHISLEQAHEAVASVKQLAEEAKAAFH